MAEASGSADPADGSSEVGAGRHNWRNWYVWALVAAAAAYCFGPSLVGARTLISVNFLTHWLPWQAAEGNVAVGHELCQSDTIDSMLPATHYTVAQVLSGHLASWQNLQTGGGPLSALPNDGLLDPLSLPYWLLPARWAPAFVTLLCWAAAIAGSYLFLRRLAVSRPAATLAGFVFATSGFMVMWTNWPQTRTAALIPLLFWSIDRLASTRRFLDLVLVAIVLASMLLGGFPQVTGFAVYLGAVYYVVRVLTLNRKAGGGPAPAVRAWLMGAGGLILGGALSAIQMLPFYDFYETHGFAYREALSRTGVPLSGLTTVVAPGATGLCVVQSDGVVDAHSALSAVELVAYVGAAAVVIVVAGLLIKVAPRRPVATGVKAFFVVAALVITALGFGPSWVRSVADHFPVFNNSFIGRIRSVMGFALAMLVGFGFDAVLARYSAPRSAERTSARLRISPCYAVVVAAMVVVGAIALREGHRAAFQGHYLEEWDHAVGVAAIFAVVAAAVVAAAAILRRARVGRVANRVAFVVLPVLVVAQGVQFFHAVMPGDSPSSFYPNTADHQFLEEHVGTDRFGSSGLTLYPSTAMYYGLRSVTGHQFTDSSWNRLLTAVDPGVMESATNSVFDAQINSASIGRQPILDQMGVRYFVLPDSQLTGTPSPLPATSRTVTGASGQLTCTLGGGPIRGVTVKLAGPLSGSRAGTGPTIDVKVSTGAVSVTSGLYSMTALSSGQTLDIPVAGESLPLDSTLTVQLSASGAEQPLVLAATSDGTAACSAYRPSADGLRLVFASSAAVIYERLTSVPRIRWDANATVETDPAAQLAALKAGLPPSTVLLSTPGGAGSGQPAAVQVLSDDDQITARVDATGAGYLVVADAMQVPGWSVTVDGRPARLLPADYAMVAVAVPAGNHLVQMTYTAPGELAGAVVTGVAVIIAIVLIWVDRPRSAPRRSSARAD